ncbi:MAG: alpha-amylase/alpha-mannosidase [Nitrospinae bacterium]|nr:alpha-amylase/alpha-mannosidase [Nitrospinota bacterium]
MHQPYYLDPLTNRTSMPWVRLHGTKSYYDMIRILDEFPSIKVTFNLVPSLLKQFTAYIDNNVKDTFLEHSIKPASDLTEPEKRFILTNFFMINWETIIIPNKGYLRLLEKRGRHIFSHTIDDAVKRFTYDDIRDLQTWFNLAWFGFKAEEEYEEIRELKKKGRSFSEDDKNRIINIQMEILKKIIPAYKTSEEKGQIELSTSPFYHPIMPLLYNTEISRRSLPDNPMPEIFSNPDDVSSQIRLAIEYHEKVFGKRPNGIWPSEGSVCPEIIQILHDSGIKWTATDEGILFKTIGKKDKAGYLYKPYKAIYHDKDVAIIFRDQGLSDLVGFTYSKNPQAAAANDLIQHLYEIKNALSDKAPLVSIILDGENPWEHYPNNGGDFLRNLYKGLSDAEELETVRINDYLNENPPADALENIHSGSWINSNFAIWIGSYEKNLGWDYLKRTKEFLKEAEQTGQYSSDDINKCYESIYMAEGSDWFWWYGDDFFSDNDEEFDRLFRTHLSNVYRILKNDVPSYLETPIIQFHEVRPENVPVGFITPVIDGRVTDYFEWLEAGCILSTRHRGTMYKTERFLEEIYYGFDLNKLYIRIDPILNLELEEDLEAQIIIFDKEEFRLIFPFGKKGVASYELIKAYNGRTEKIKDIDSISVDKIIELSIPFSELKLKAGETAKINVKLEKNDIETERYPQKGFILLTVPDENFERIMWRV